MLFVGWDILVSLTYLFDVEMLLFYFIVNFRCCHEITRIASTLAPSIFNLAICENQVLLYNRRGQNARGPHAKDFLRAWSKILMMNDLIYWLYFQ